MSDKNKLWKKVGKLAVEKAVETVVEEGVEASVEIWKKYRLKLQKEWFDRRKEERDNEPSDDSEEASTEDTEQESDQAEQSEASHQFPQRTVDGGGNFDSFSDYVKRKKPGESG